jgi:hypothetical protein
MGDLIHTMELHKRQFDDIVVNFVLQSVAYGLHTTYHSFLAASPCQVVFGCNMIINADYIANWKDIANHCHNQIVMNNAREN